MSDNDLAGCAEGGRARTTQPTSQPVKLPQLTFNQIDQLARGLACDLMGADENTRRVLMLLIHQIAEHPFDTSYVETIAGLMTDHLLMASGEGNAAMQEAIHEFCRPQLQCLQEATARR